MKKFDSAHVVFMTLTTLGYGTFAYELQGLINQINFFFLCESWNNVRLGTPKYAMPVL